MLGERLGPVIRRLRGAVEPAEVPTDADLLRRFVDRRDPAAFELLVWRHGGLVLGACRRILGRTPDADDAFQATFLTLLRKAGSIGRRQALAAWLYRVAHRIAVRSRQQTTRQRRLEQRAEPPPAAGEPVDPDLRAVLDEELQRLPVVFRLPVVLCYLEGLTNEEAARRLGCPKGTVVSRLARARRRLSARLTRRGLAPAVVAAVLAEPTASEALPPALVAAVARLAAEPAAARIVPAAVAALAHGELRAMMLTRIKIVVAAALVLTAGGTGVGTGLFKGALGAATQPPVAAAGIGPMNPLPAQARNKPAEDPKPGASSPFVKAVGRCITPALKPRWDFGGFESTVPESVARLTSFFPGVGEGKQSSRAGGWRAWMTIRFERADGTAVQVNVSQDCTIWSEGHGDWDAKPGLAEFIEKVIVFPADSGTGDWSAPDNGLRGRLVLRPRPTAEEYGPALRGVSLEVENSNHKSLMVRADPNLAVLDLTDAAGQRVPEKQFGMYTGIIPEPQSGLIPGHAYLGFALDDYSRVVPKEGGTGLVLCGHCWLLQPGRYTLRGTFRFDEAAKTRLRMPQEAWTGRLELPPLTIDVR